MGMRRTLFCVVVCLCCGSVASAYTLRHDASGRTLRWPGSLLPIEYRVGFSGSVGQDEVLTGAVVRALESWNRVSGSYLQFRYAGRTRVDRAAPDGVNCVIWVTSGWRHRPDAIAYATPRKDASGRIVETDIEINAQHVAWSTQGVLNAFDVQNAVTHEGGHAAGLAHSLDSTGATMFPIIKLGEVFKRSLDGDDIDAIQALYPIVGSELVVYEPAVEADALRPLRTGLLREGAGDTPAITLRADADGDGISEFGLFRRGPQPSFSMVSLAEDVEQPALVAYDEWEVPSGEVEDATAIDIDGDGLDELLVLKAGVEQAAREVVVYDMLAWGDLNEAQARPPVARDAWRIPEGGPVLAVFTVRRPSGSSLAVVRATAEGVLELVLSTPPRRGDSTEQDAARGTSETVFLPRGFTSTDIDAADLNGDGIDEIVVLDQTGEQATVRIYALALDARAPVLMLALRHTLPVPLADGERALGLVGVDLDGTGVDRLGIVHGETR
ncbi:MAG: matrixin family metalloprotease [Verrucomicrobia bacterium]|nr:matrixin family metalloprotease [Verrucomicrobiota bacterium]